MARHKIKRKYEVYRDAEISGMHVTYAECKCGWKTKKYNTEWIYCEDTLKQAEHKHFVKVGYIKK